MKLIHKQREIEKRIFVIRGEQIILDEDLAAFYDIAVKRLNEQTKRNQDRFPEDFCFQLTNEEYEVLRSQNATLKIGSGTHRKYLPYVFTEEGVAAVSAVIKNQKAAEISVLIMRAFVQMRKFLLQNAPLYQRLDRIELKQISADQKFEQIFTALEKDIKPQQGIFFEGQLFDAYSFAADLIKSAKKSLILIDNYVDETTLMLLTKRKIKVAATIYTKKISKQLALDLEKHNSQYSEIKVFAQTQSHDRFLIIDNIQVYHFGASLKDLGHKCFAFSRMDFVLKDLQKKILN
jgi:hypothetical protein